MKKQSGSEVNPVAQFLELVKSDSSAASAVDGDSKLLPLLYYSEKDESVKKTGFDFSKTQASLKILPEYGSNHDTVEETFIREHLEPGDFFYSHHKKMLYYLPSEGGNTSSAGFDNHNKERLLPLGGPFADLLSSKSRQKFFIGNTSYPYKLWLLDLAAVKHLSRISHYALFRKVCNGYLASSFLAEKYQKLGYIVEALCDHVDKNKQLCVLLSQHVEWFGSCQSAENSDFSAIFEKITDPNKALVEAVLLMRRCALIYSFREREYAQSRSALLGFAAVFTGIVLSLHFASMPSYAFIILALIGAAVGFVVPFLPFTALGNFYQKGYALEDIDLLRAAIGNWLTRHPVTGDHSTNARDLLTDMSLPASDQESSATLLTSQALIDLVVDESKQGPNQFCSNVLKPELPPQNQNGFFASLKQLIFGGQENSCSSSSAARA